MEWHRFVQLFAQNTAYFCTFIDYHLMRQLGVFCEIWHLKNLRFREDAGRQAQVKNEGIAA